MSEMALRRTVRKMEGYWTPESYRVVRTVLMWMSVVVGLVLVETRRTTGQVYKEFGGLDYLAQLLWGIDDDPVGITSMERERRILNSALSAPILAFLYSAYDLCTTTKTPRISLAILALDAATWPLYLALGISVHWDEPHYAKRIEETSVYFSKFRALTGLSAFLMFAAAGCVFLCFVWNCKEMLLGFRRRRLEEKDVRPAEGAGERMLGDYNA